MRKLLIGVFIFFAAAAAGLGVAYLRQSKSNLVPSPEGLGSQAKISSNKSHSVEKKIIFQPESQKIRLNSYTLIGVFTSSPVYKNGATRGEFRIDEDPNQTKIPVKFNDDVTILKYKGSFSATPEEVQMPLDELKKAIDADNRGLVRILILAEGASEEKKNAAVVLEGLVQNGWSIPSGFTLTPDVIGVVVK